MRVSSVNNGSLARTVTIVPPEVGPLEGSTVRSS